MLPAFDFQLPKINHKASVKRSLYYCLTRPLKHSTTPTEVHPRLMNYGNEKVLMFDRISFVCFCVTVYFATTAEGRLSEVFEPRDLIAVHSPGGAQSQQSRNGYRP